MIIRLPLCMPYYCHFFSSHNPPQGRRPLCIPAGLHTQTDLDRMKTVPQAPIPDCDWNILITDCAGAKHIYGRPQANMGANRQRADADAHAAYLNAIRWYISGNTSYADCAVRICNAWSSAVNQVPTGTDIPGLSGISIFDFALAAEVLRIYPGMGCRGLHPL